MPSDLPHPGELLAGYRIERRLGRGATGVVYLARQVALDRPVALKVVGAPFAVDEGFRSRFRHEARAAAALDHPNVVTVLDSGEDDERLWLAMRLVDGPDLRVLLRRTGRLEPAHAVSVVEQVAAALDAAHAAGLVHRDVKPGNVLVEDAPGGALHAELADFGLAGGVATAGADSGDGARPIEGTPAYAAPEQLAGHEATAAADVYGLGRVFAEMLTGDPATPADPGGTGFAGVVARATDPDPAWRYPTAGALAVAARAVLEPGGAQVATRGVGPAGATPTTGAVAAAGLAGGAVAAGGASSWGSAAGVAGRLPSPDEVAADAEYEDVAPLTPPPTGPRPSTRRRATTLVAVPRPRRPRWVLPFVALLGVVAAAALVLGELRNGLLTSDPASERTHVATGASRGSASGTPSGSAREAARDRSGGTAVASGGTTAGRSARPGVGSAGAPSDRSASADRSGGVSSSSPSSAPVVGATGPGTAPTAAAFPPPRGHQRFGGGSWALDLPADGGWRQTAVQELSGGRTVLTRLRRADGARLVVEHRPGQTAVFGPWPGRPFAVRTPDAGRLDALLFRGGRYAMCRDGVCGAVPVNGPSGGVLLIAAPPGNADAGDAGDAAARRELRRAARGLRVG